MPAKNLNVQAYVDIREFAALVSLLESQGWTGRGSYSETIRLLISNVLRAAGKRPFPDTEEALAYLAEHNYSLAQLGERRRGRALRVSLQAEDLAETPGLSHRASEIAQLLPTPEDPE